MRLRPIFGQPGNSSIMSRVKLRQTTVQLGKKRGCGTSFGSHHRDRDVSICKAPSLSTGSTMPLTGTETVQERPLLSWKGETRVPDYITNKPLQIRKYQQDKNLTSIAGDTGKDDPSHANCPSRPMHRGIEASHSFRQIDITIHSAIQTIDYAEIADRCQAPEQYHQRLHRYNQSTR